MKKLTEEKAYHPSGVYRIPENLPQDFKTYTEHCRHKIELARVDLHTAQREQIIAANCPFELQPTTPQVVKKGVLLMHGLYDSPAIMQSVAHYFAGRGFVVRVLLLPGHGTVPGDLLEVTYQDWLACAQSALTVFAQEVDALYLGGFSTGGTIAISLALSQPQAIQRLFLWAPALTLAPYLTYAARFHKHIAWLLPHPQWLCVTKEVDYAKYHSFTVNSLCQIYRLSQIVKQRLQQQPLSMPSFWVLTRNDEVLSSAALVQTFLAKTTATSEMIYYAPEPVHFADPRIEWRLSQRPDQRIIDISHVALAVSPSHFHYGVEKDFQAILLAHLAKQNKEPLLYGSLKNLKLSSRASLVRLTYNPDFDYMTQKMDGFLGV